MSRWAQRTTEQRFLEKVDVDEASGCWMWTGHIHKGYGRFRVDGKTLEAHIWAYRHWVGLVPDGLMLDHFACDRRSCANPAHVRPVTSRENTLRGDTIPARKLAQTSCVNGHEFDERNTYIAPNGTRACRRCRADVEARRRARRRAA